MDGRDLIRKVLLATAMLLSLLLVIALFLPARYDYRWSIEIEAEVEKVYTTLANFHSWQHWDVWQKRDPKAKFEITGQPGKPGHLRSWQGPTMGKGHFLLLQTQKPSEVAILMKVEEPHVLLLEQKFFLTPLPKGNSLVTWSVSGELVYPLGRILGLFLKKFVEPDFLESLSNLKHYLEKK